MLLRTFILYSIGMTLGALVTFPIFEHFLEQQNLQEKIPSQLDRFLTDGNENTTAVHVEENENGPQLILFTFVSLMVACILKEIKKKLHIPFSPMMLTVGILWGLFHSHLYKFGEAVELVNSIDPHALLYIFIPGLVFEGAYNTDGYVLGKSKWQILLLAGPGVLVTTGALAFGLYSIFGYGEDLSIQQTLVIGSIISTTDPVAVVALLKELGTSIKFNTLLEGESLLNDGTAYVVFLICEDIVNTGKFNFWDGVFKLFRMSFGGPLFGIFLGYLCTLWLETILKDNTLIVMITVFSAYLLFFLSETLLEISGILGLVGFGIYLGTNGRAQLNHQNAHCVHTVWSFLTFCLESMIFVITGTFIGNKFADFQDLELYYNDIWKSILFYFFIFIFRYLLNLVFFPIINKLGYKLTHTGNLILSYGGLRGAIALSLSMIIALNEKFEKRFRDLCLFYTVIVILMSVLVNGLTIKFLMQKTGFLKSNLLKVKLYKSLFRQFILKTIEFETEVKNDKKLNGVNWKDVEKLVHLANYKVLDRISKWKKREVEKKKKELKVKKKNKSKKEFQDKKKKTILDRILHWKKKATSNHSKLEKSEKKDQISNSMLVSPQRVDSVTKSAFHKEPTFSEIKPQRTFSGAHWKINTTDQNLNLDLEVPTENNKLLKESSGNLKIETPKFKNKYDKAIDFDFAPESSIGPSPSRQLDNFSEAKNKKLEKSINIRKELGLDASTSKQDLSESGTSTRKLSSLNRNSASEDIHALFDQELSGIDRELIKQELRFRIYKLVKHHVNEKRDNNECRSDVVSTIKTLCNICNDHIDQQICFYEYSKVFIGNHKSMEFLSKLSKMPFVGRFFIRELSHSIFYEYQFLETLISICDFIVKDLKEQEISEEYKAEAEYIKEEMVVDIQKLKMLEESFIVQFSGFVNFIRTKMAAYNLIQYQKSQVDNFEHLGMIDGTEKESWVAKLDSRIVDVHNYKPRQSNINIVNLNTFSLDFPIFACLNKKENDILIESRYLSDYRKGGNV